MALGGAVIRIWRQVQVFLGERNLEPFPLVRSLKRYSSNRFQKDLHAGFTVALLAIPQGMAYAMIAGLPNVAYGILCSAVGAVLAGLFCSSRHTIVGPTNATALLVFSVLAGGAAAVSTPLILLPALIFMSGMLLIIGAYLRMADMIQYISRSVVVGYVTGAACLIMAGQIREVMGIRLPSDAIPGANFVGQVRDFIRYLPEARLWTCLISLGTFGIYFSLRRWAPRLSAFSVTLLLASFVCWALQKGGLATDVARLQGFSIENLLPGIPDFRDLEVLEQLPRLFGPAMAIAFLAALEMSVMSKSLASKSGDRPDPNQDLLGLGVANLGSSFLSAMPVSGSLTRSALNWHSGAQSQIAGIISGLICFASALLLGGVVPLIPKCSLAVLVICIAFSLFNRRNLRICLKATTSDATTLIVTILATLLLPLHVAIFLGVATSVILYLRKASRPVLVEYEFNQDGDLKQKEQADPRQNPQISIVHVEGELFFGAAELFRTQIQRTVVDPNLRVIILRMKNARHLDATSVMALEELITFLRQKNRHLIISGALKEVYRVLRNSGMVEVIGRDNIFPGSPKNPNISTRNALKRAQALLGTDKADIRIYIDPNKPVE